LARGAGFSIKSPPRHVGLEGRLKGGVPTAQTRPGSRWSNRGIPSGKTAHRRTGHPP
jgi:hypothetical protein